MNYKKQPKGFIKSLQIIHYAFLFGVVGFAAYVAIKNNDLLFFSYEEDRMFLYLAIIIAFAGNISSKYLYSKMISQISIKDDLNEKVTKYSSSHIFRLAMLEFPALMCVIFALQSSNSFYFIIVGILVFMMLTILPTKSKFANDVPLTDKEKLILEIF